MFGGVKAEAGLGVDAFETTRRMMIMFGLHHKNNEMRVRDCCSRVCAMKSDEYGIDDIWFGHCCCNTDHNSSTCRRSDPRTTPNPAEVSSTSL